MTVHQGVISMMIMGFISGDSTKILSSDSVDLGTSCAEDRMRDALCVLSSLPYTVIFGGQMKNDILIPTLLLIIADLR